MFYIMVYLSHPSVNRLQNDSFALESLVYFCLFFGGMKEMSIKSAFAVPYCTLLVFPLRFGPFITFPASFYVCYVRNTMRYVSVTQHSFHRRTENLVKLVHY